jgi:hypothetical protein
MHTFCSQKLFALHVLLDCLQALVHKLPCERTVQHKPANSSSSSSAVVVLMLLQMALLHKLAS